MVEPTPAAFPPSPDPPAFVLADALRERLGEGPPGEACLQLLADRLEVPRCTWSTLAGGLSVLQAEFRRGALVPAATEPVPAGVRQALAAGEPLLLDDVGALQPGQRPPLHGAGVASALVLPVPGETALAGLLTVQDFAARRWRREEVAWALQYAAQLGRLLQARELQPDRRYRDLFRANPHPMWIYDQDSLAMLAVNDAACQLYGYTAGEFLRLTVEDIRAPGETAPLRQELAAVRRERASRHVLRRHRTRSGRVIDVEITSHVIDYAGREARLVLAQDQTERLRAERRLRESEATLRSFYDSTQHLMGVVEVAPDRDDVLHVDDNPATSTFFGVPPGSTRGRWASELGTGAHVLALWCRHYRQAQRERGAVRFDYVQPLHGRPAWLAVTVAPIGPGEEGRWRYSYVAEDITERKQAEQRAIEGEQQLALALRAGQLGFWDWDLRTGGVQFGGHWAAMLGRRLEDLAPGHAAWRELVHPDDIAHVQAAREAHVAGGSPHYEVEHRLRHADGSWRWVMARAEVVERGPGGQALRILGVHADITERKRIEEELRQGDRRKDEFLAVLAHELRNPLAPVRTAVEILRRCELADARAQSARDVIGRQVEHMVRLIDDLLDVARITHGKVAMQRGPLVLQDVVRSAVETVQPHVQAAGQQLSLSLPEQPLVADGDAVRLAQVVLNLLGNASRYTPHGGRLALVLRQDGARAVVEVSDTGIGLAPEHLRQVFGMFSQVQQGGPAAGGGLGIGLALARAIVQAHGGTIAASSPGPGAGSTFTVSVPLAPGQVAPQPAVPAAPAVAHGPQALRVLVVDDHADAADTLATLLGLLGHDVRTARGGREALSVAAAWHPQLVLLDLGMPDGDGLEAARAICALGARPRPVLVAVTGWGQDEDRRRTAQAGFDGHLVKPADEAGLRPWLEMAQGRVAGGA